MTNASHMLKIEVIIRTTRISEAVTILEMIGIEINIIKVIEETFSTDTGHITEIEAGIEMIEEELVGIEETMDLGMEADPSLWIKVKREGVSTENSDIRTTYLGMSKMRIQD